MVYFSGSFSIVFMVISCFLAAFTDNFLTSDQVKLGIFEFPKHCKICPV